MVFEAKKKLLYNLNQWPSFKLTLVLVWAFCTFSISRAKAEVNASIGSGWTHTLILKTDGSLWGTGRGYQGELGINPAGNSDLFVKVLDEGVKSLHPIGGQSSLFIKSDNTLWGMGKNANGELRDGTTTQRENPIQVWSSSVAKASGSYHTIFLETNGTLRGMGTNANGQLGDGTTTDKSTPIIIFGSGVADFAVGVNHTLVLKTDGTLWGFGKNTAGQLGNGSTTTSQSIPVQISITQVAQVAAGGDHSLVLKTDGSLWAMGANDFGQLGDGSTTNQTSPLKVVDGNVTHIACGSDVSYFLKTDGSLWAMGSNEDGQLGNLSLSNTSLQGWWSEINNNNVWDNSGNGNTGTVTGATIGLDRYGRSRAMQFDGVDDKIEITENTNLAIDDNLSVFLWYKNLDTSSPSVALIGKSDQYVPKDGAFGMSLVVTGICPCGIQVVVGKSVEMPIFNSGTTFGLIWDSLLEAEGQSFMKMVVR